MLLRLETHMPVASNLAFSQGQQLGISQAILRLALLCFNDRAQVCERNAQEGGSNSLFHAALV